MKKTFFSIFILGLIIVGCGAQKPQAEKFSGSIEDLTAKYKSIKCELIAGDDDTMISGTTYISNGKARSDYQSKIEDETVTGHMINDGTWLYTWIDEFPGQAMKVELSAVQSDALKAAQTGETGYENYEAKMDYNCYQWAKDDSLLTPPAGLNFQDYTALIQSAQGLLNGAGNADDADSLPTLINTDKSAMCSACDQVPDTKAKSMCRQRLGCD